MKRAADKNLPPLTLPSPPLPRGAGGGEGTFESAARLTEKDGSTHHRFQPGGVSVTNPQTVLAHRHPELFRYGGLFNQHGKTTCGHCPWHLR